MINYDNYLRDCVPLTDLIVALLLVDTTVDGACVVSPIGGSDTILCLGSGTGFLKKSLQLIWFKVYYQILPVECYHWDRIAQEL